MGEEWGMLNDYDFVEDPAKAGDTRWIHRPKMNWEYLDPRDADAGVGEGPLRKRLFTEIRRLIHLRQSLPALAGQNMELMPTANPHVLGYLRVREGHRLIVLANFSDTAQTVPGNNLRTVGLGRFFVDAVTKRTAPTSSDVVLEPYQFLWLQRD
jgi:amylosucrase